MGGLGVECGLKSWGELKVGEGARWFMEVGCGPVALYHVITTKAIKSGKCSRVY